MSKMRKLLESLDDIIDGEPVGAEKPAMAKPKSSTKFLGKPYKRGEDDQEVTETEDEDDEEKDLKESLKAQFEDYVKNKAVPDSKKELKLEKQEDGSYQVKNEKGNVVCRGTKSDCQTHITKKNAELNDAKLDEGLGNAIKKGVKKLTAPVKDPILDQMKDIVNTSNKRAHDAQNKKYAPHLAQEGIGDSIKRGLDNNADHPNNITRAPTSHFAQRDESVEDVMHGGANAKTNRDLKKADNTPFEAHGVRGMSRAPWRKTFKNGDAMEAWCDKYDAECHGTRDLEQAKKGNLTPAVESTGGSKSEKMAKLKSILDKLSDELKNTRKQIGANKKVTEAPIDQQVPTAAGNTVQAAPGVVQAAGQAQQAPANQQGAVPANQSQQLPKPAPGQPQTTAQQAPAQPGQKTVAPAPGQPTPPAAGQAGGAPVAQPPGTPAPAQGSAVNAASTPADQVKGLVQTLASNPGAAKQLGTKLNTVMK